jgi:uridine kinase
MGASIYRRSAIIILYEAARELYPELYIEIGQAIGNGYHFLFQGKIPEDPEWIKRLERYCHYIITQRRPFNRIIANAEEANELFRELNAEDKIQLLRVINTDLIHLVSLGHYYDIQHGPVAPTTGHIEPFHLEPFSPGFVLEFKDILQHIGIGRKAIEQQKLFQAYQETREWNRILGITSVGQLNDLALKGNVRDIIQVTEGFHEKKIAQIADQIVQRLPAVKVVLVAGPSSSGKTTFINRLGVQLRVNGASPVSISLDNYYLNREQMPLLPDGRYDLESIHALDLDLLNQHLADLMRGKEIQQPLFDFTTGKRLPQSQWQTLCLKSNQILMIEGIHGLNPLLTSAIPVSSKFRIFINALTQLNLDRSNRQFTSETRLLRRIVRDRRYRGYSAADTIEKWPLVREAERRHIFTYQEEADALFNSALVYEGSVLKMFAERYLLEVPREHPSSVFAHRLRNFLQLFVPIMPNDIPHNSILREFVGDAQNY